ncbi:hypothetical protein P692DRAFT_201066230 [Suillus brevipes Sb2]|nr:hypothetical protein P692DRAFT_201066230 [Suillus brevipes Sb2]
MPASIVPNNPRQCGNTPAGWAETLNLFSPSAELYPQSPYLYFHPPLPLIQPITLSICDPRQLASSLYHV